MRVIADFKCNVGHVCELFIDNSVREADCPDCGKLAKRVISPVRTKLDPISGDFPGATMKWARMREKEIALERKRENA